MSTAPQASNAAESVGDPVPSASNTIGNGDSANPTGAASKNPEDKSTTAQEPDLLKPFTRNWAQGARLAFLQQSLQVYNKAALKSSRKAQDALDSIINNYFKQFNWRHPVSREPKPDDPPLDAPKAKLSAPEEKLKQQVIAKMKDSISGWMRYRANKVDRGLRQITNTSPNNPYAILLSQLSGIGLKPPKRLCAWQMLLKHGFEPHAKDFQESFAASGEPQTEMANKRNEYAQAIFDGLKPPEKEVWAQRAKDAHEAQRAEVEARAERILAFTPEERQEALERLGDFFYPIMEGVSEITRCHVTVLVGGPEPAQGGQINVLSLHVGENLSAIPKTWSEGDKPGHDICVQAYQRWLETCFTPEDQRAAAIPGTRAAALPSSRTQLSTNLHKRKENDRDSPPDPPRSDSRSVHHSSSKHKRRRARHSSSDIGGSESDSDSDSSTSKRRAKRRKERRREKKKARKAKSKRDREALSSDEDEPNMHRSQRLTRERPPQVVKIGYKTIPRAAASPQDLFTDDDMNLSTHDANPPPEKQKQALDAPEASSPSIRASEGNVSPHGHIPTAPSTPVPASPKPAPAPLKASEADTGAASPTAPSNLLHNITDIPHSPSRAMERESPYVKPDAYTPVDPQWPEWFKRVYKTLTGPAKMPPAWLALVKMYVRLEQQTNFANPERVSLVPAMRPSQIPHWISRGRKVTVVPIPDLDDFTASWWAWWVSLQPAWRGVAGQGSLHLRHRHFTADQSEVPGGWKGLDIPGANGIASIMACLAWWAIELDKLVPEGYNWVCETEGAGDWVEAVADVTWVINSIILSRRNGSD